MLDLFQLTLSHLIQFGKVMSVHDDGSSAGHYFILLLFHGIWSPLHSLPIPPNLLLLFLLWSRGLEHSKLFSHFPPKFFYLFQGTRGHNPTYPIFQSIPFSGPIDRPFTSPASLRCQFLGGGARAAGW